jgi:CubicO group peptidase (beta-lactamase class C family)
VAVLPNHRKASDSAVVLPSASPEALGLDPRRLDDLYRLIEEHIQAGHYPGAQVAIARHGKLAAQKSFGQARIQPAPQAATDNTLWLLYSQTKVITVAALWQLVDRGALSFADRIADHVPEFAAGGKDGITVHQLLTHQAGFPSAVVPTEAWTDHELLRKIVSEFALEWWPGSKVQYHGGSAHWTAAVVIEAVTGRDYREVIKTDLLEPLGLSDIVVGVPAEHLERCADMHVLRDRELVPLAENNHAAFRAAGVPGGGGYATAAAMAAFYQMLAAEGSLNGVRVLSPRVIQYATRNHTEERIDEQMRMPMHRGVGPHVRGLTATIRGLGTIASPRTFGHGGAGSSYSWADPDTGVSFTYLANCRSDEPFHSQRLDHISNIVHAAIVEV